MEDRQILDDNRLPGKTWEPPRLVSLGVTIPEVTDSSPPKPAAASEHFSPAQGVTVGMS